MIKLSFHKLLSQRSCPRAAIESCQISDRSQDVGGSYTTVAPTAGVKQLVEEKITEILPKVTIEQQELEEDKATLRSLSGGVIELDAIAGLQETEVSTNGLTEQPTPRSPINPFEKPSAAAVRKVAEAEIALLSQKLGAKAIAEIALDLCTLDEIKTITPISLQISKHWKRRASHAGNLERDKNSPLGKPRATKILRSGKRGQFSQSPDSGKAQD